MGFDENHKGHQQLQKGQIAFPIGRQPHSLNILTKGSIDLLLFPGNESQLEGLSPEEIVKQSYRIYSVGQNTFVGVDAVFNRSSYQLNYRAGTESSLFLLPIDGELQLKNLLKTKKEYAAYILTTLASLIEKAYGALKTFHRLERSLHILTDNYGSYYWFLQSQLGFTVQASSSSFEQFRENFQKMQEKEISFPQSVHDAFLEKDFSGIIGKQYLPKITSNAQLAEYYRHISALPLELRKEFFGRDMFITFFNCERASELLDDFYDEIRRSIVRLEALLQRIYSDNGESLISEYVHAGKGILQESGDTEIITNLLQKLRGKFHDITGFMQREYQHEYPADLEYIDNLIAQLQQGQIPEQSVSVNTAAVDAEIADLLGETGIKDEKSPAETLPPGTVPSDLKESYKTLLQECKIEKDPQQQFIKALNAFVKCDDRNSALDNVRKIRRILGKSFFDIYESIFKNTHSAKKSNRLLDMFFNFGYMDERLLKPDQLLTLYKLTDNTKPTGNIPIHTMRQWMELIYQGKKDPSYDENGLDYFAAFRELKKRGRVTDADEEVYNNDMDKRLNHEVQNMIKITHRLCNGHLSTYAPVLHSDMIIAELDRALITKEALSAAVNRLLDIDFSVFHREVMYKNPEKNIDREFVMQQVIPDFILSPTYGTRSFMWQELTSRDKRSPGRILLPAFSTEDVFDMVVAAAGAFRWELCKTIMGPSWNDISQSSITADYTDYIQFFKKNRDLSDEAKDKIKVQITKCRNNYRDMFVQDYMLWVNFESQGIMRLNKVARGIMYKHCPFKRELRENLSRQPMFAKDANRFKNIRAKKAKTLANHYHKYTKTGDLLDPILEENLDFFQNK